jgi:hypothetical protein
MSSSWQINPGAVQTILTSVDTDRTELDTALSQSKFEAIFNGLDWGGGVTGVVPEAVNNLLNDQMTNLTNIGNRINAGLAGVTNATIAYNNGQVDMAGTYQTEMVAAAETGDFQYFEQHGQTGS